MKTVIFTTEAQAEEQQAKDLVCHLMDCTNSKYKTQTTRWANPKLRLDGDWDYVCCDMQDYTGMTVEDYNKDNYEQQDESEV